jgi:hypothetical protein
MNMTGIKEVAEVGRYAMLMNHLKNNRIEYLLCVGILHLVGITNKAYAQVQGVCI